MRLIATILLCVLGTMPQQVGQNAPITAKPQLTVNSTTQLVVHGMRRGEEYRWRPRIGKQIIL